MLLEFKKAPKGTFEFFNKKYTECGGSPDFDHPREFKSPDESTSIVLHRHPVEVEIYSPDGSASVLMAVSQKEAMGTRIWYLMVHSDNRYLMPPKMRLERKDGKTDYFDSDVSSALRAFRLAWPKIRSDFSNSSS